MGSVQSAELSTDPGPAKVPATPPATATKAVTALQDIDKLRREFDKLFADMEFRAKRSAMMNYHEAERYDSRADLLQTVSTIVGALGVSGIGASVAKFKQVTASSAGVAGVLALPLCGILQFLSNGSSSMAPTVGEKARMHVRAGAGWQRIARQTRAYRVQLKYTSDDNVDSPLLTAWYREVVQASEEVSRILPIKADTYAKFDETETVRDRLYKRQMLVQKYIDMEEGGQK